MRYYIDYVGNKWLFKKLYQEEKSIASTPVQQNCTGFHETDDAVIAEKINRAVCHQRNVDSNCISLVNIRFMEHFCNSNQSFHVFNPTGFANGKKLHFHGMLESCSCDWKSRNILWSGIGTTKSAAEHYLSANRFNPHSCIAIDCSCI